MLWQVIGNDKGTLDNAVRAGVGATESMTVLVIVSLLNSIDLLDHGGYVIVLVWWYDLDAFRVPADVVASGQVVYVEIFGGGVGVGRGQDGEVRGGVDGGGCHDVVRGLLGKRSDKYSTNEQSKQERHVSGNIYLYKERREGNVREGLDGPTPPWTYSVSSR